MEVSKMQTENINQIDVKRLQEVMGQFRHSPELGKYQFRAKNKWVSGAHSHSVIKDFQAGGQEDTSREDAHILIADEPTSLLGGDLGANATETLLHALGACLNASFIYHAANQGVEVEQLEIELEGDLDLNGFLGIDENVPSNFQQIRVKFKVKADASEEKIQELCEYAQKRSPVFNSISKPVPITVTLETTKMAHAHG